MDKGTWLETDLMAHHFVFCIPSSRETAIKIVEQLQVNYFSNEAIGVLLTDNSFNREVVYEPETKAPRSAIGMLARVSAIEILGEDGLIAAGPIVMAVNEFSLSSKMGGIAGALIGMGLDQVQAKTYQSRIRDGSILICVEAKDSEEITIAKRVFTQSSADEITLVEQSSPSNGRPSKLQFTESTASASKAGEVGGLSRGAYD